MCTSFIYRGQDTIIGMNFDNNGMKYSIDTKNPNWFTVQVDGGCGKYPTFGVDCFGRFFNNLVVNSNGKVVCPDGCVMFRLTAKELGNENFIRESFLNNRREL